MTCSGTRGREGVLATVTGRWAGAPYDEDQDITVRGNI